MPTLDAREHHDPGKAPGLVAAAISAVGTQKEVAERVGVTPRYLQMLARGEYRMSYPLQYCLERLSAK